MAKKTKVEDEAPEQVLSPQDQIKAFLSSKEHKEDHYNFEEAHDYKISSGSLILDLETGGGLGPGVHRFTGISEGGKSSCTLAYAREFQQKHGDEGMVIYIKSEGRLSKDMLERSGVDTSPDKWFVFETNIYETAVDLMRDLVTKNPNRKFYLFIVDCVDALMPKKDIAKGTEEAAKVAGGAVLGTDFLRRLSLAMSKRGHMVILISQIRAQVQIDPYAKKEYRLTSSSGGNALVHYANWIYEFQPRFKDDLFYDAKGKIIGHYAKIIFRKSMNERTNLLVKYPIKYGRENGRSIWVEKEVADLLLAFGLFKAAGAWVTVEESLIKEAAQSKVEIPARFNGQAKVLAWLEENEEVTKFLFNKLYNLIMGENTVLSSEVEEEKETVKTDF